MMRSTALYAALVALAAGCGSRGSLYTGQLEPLPFVATQSSLVMVVPQTQRLVAVTPSEKVPSSVAVSEKPRLARTVPGTDTVLVLAGTAKAPVLDLVDVGSGEVRTVAVPGLFDATSFSADGQWAVLTYTASGGGGLAAKNLNEIALVNVASAEVTRVQLDTESLAPRSVLFGPDEPDRQLVAVALERGVAVFDARDPARPPKRISIRPQGSQVESSVLEAVFAPDASFLYVRATGLDDVIAVELTREADGLGAAINFLAGGRGLADIELRPDGGPGVVALYTETRDAFLLDPHGVQDNIARIDLPAGLNRIQPLTGSRVLMFSQAVNVVMAWDVVDGRTGAAVLDSTYDAPRFSPQLGLGVFPHPSVRSLPGASAALSVVTVEDDVNRLRTRIRSILLQAPLTSASLDLNQRRIFFAESGVNAVVSLNLTSLELSQMNLDAQPASLFHIPDGDWVAAVHPQDKLGDVTFYPAASSERTEAIRFRYLALTDDLDRPHGDAQ